MADFSTRARELLVWKVLSEFDLIFQKNLFFFYLVCNFFPLVIYVTFPTSEQNLRTLFKPERWEIAVRKLLKAGSQYDASTGDATR